MYKGRDAKGGVREEVMEPPLHRPESLTFVTEG